MQDEGSRRQLETPKHRRLFLWAFGEVHQGAGGGFLRTPRQQRSTRRDSGLAKSPMALHCSSGLQATITYTFGSVLAKT